MARKLKPLLPVLRNKTRYILFDIIGDKPSSEAKKVIAHGVSTYIGQVNMAASGFRFIENNIIMINRGFEHLIRAALSLITEIHGKKVIVHSMKTSGLLNKVKG